MAEFVSIDKNKYKIVGTLTEEDINKDLETMASMYQMDLEKLKEIVTDKEKEAMKKDIQVSKAVDFIMEQSK